ncbi:phage virion morphogenesis protein [Pseudacidovorax sp. 1753]|uniref:phage virion morphogenesis protein n=1 Tax=Pseudacidovorax sp. 1753 TaxID=3156419 RepID=UPI003392D04C
MAAHPLDALAGWAGPLLARLTPQRRRQLMAEISTTLRQSQAARIAAQRNPDGSAYEARKPRTIRRGMFERLRTARFLKKAATAERATVAIDPRAARIARVHQYGLRDSVDWRRAGSPTVRYARRELLGLSDADVQAIEAQLAEGLTA